MKKHLFILFLSFFLLGSVYFPLLAQTEEQNCFNQMVNSGNTAMTSKKFGFALQQYSAAYNCNYDEGEDILKGKIKVAIDSLDGLRRRAQAAELQARTNEQEAIRLKEEALSEKKAKEKALDTATYYARQAEGLLMTTLSQNLVDKGDKSMDPVLLSYAGYKLAAPESKSAAYNSYLNAAYNLFVDGAYKMEIDIDHFDQMPLSDDLLIYSDGKLLGVKKDSASRLILASCPPGSKMSAPAKSRQLVNWGYGQEFTLVNNDGINTHEFKVHTQPILSLAFSFDDRYILSGARDHNIAITPATGGNSTIISEHNGNVYEIIPHPTSNKFLSRSSDGTIQIWNIDGTHQATIKGTYFYCAAFSNDGTQVAAIDANGSVSIWDTNGNNISSFTDPILNTAEELVFVGDGQRLAIRTDHNVVIIHKESGKEHLLPYSGKIKGLEISPSGNQMLTWTNQGELSLMRINPWDTIYPQGNAEILEASFSPDGHYVLSTDVEGTVILRDLAGRKLHTWNVDPIHPIPAQFSHDSLALYIVETGNKNIRRLILPDLLLKTQQETINAYIPDYEKLAQQYGLQYVSEVWKKP